MLVLSCNSLVDDQYDITEIINVCRNKSKCSSPR